jgi:uncharacterized protein (TIGR02099 family)
VTAVAHKKSRRHRALRPVGALLRFAGWTIVALYLAFAVLVLALRYWLLPQVGDYTRDIEQTVSRTLGERVTIGGIDAGWRGLRPELMLKDVVIHDRGGRAALSLPLVDATLAWSSLAYGSLRFYSLVLDRPNLEIRRDAAGRFHVAGMELRRDAGSDSGMASWLLSQREVVIRNAALTWDDELRGAPRLALPDLSFVLRNGLTGHAFALRAAAPKELASALDVRGEFQGSDLSRIDEWKGRLYAELDYTDLAAWQRWFDYPLEIQSGKGAVRVWIDFAERRLTQFTADVALAGVATRLERTLPMLRLEYLQGRLGGKDLRATGTVEAFAKNLTLSTDSTTLAPMDFDFSLRTAAERRPASGELRATALQLQPLAKLAEYLPLPRDVRTVLNATDPRGSLSDVKLEWTGEMDSPSRYNLRSRFSGLGTRPYQHFPGFAGLSGQFEASEKGGNALLGSNGAIVELPGILPERENRLDKLTAQIQWKQAAGEVQVNFSNIIAANRDFAGTFFGSFATRKNSHGVIDLTGNLSRADGSAAYRYIPWLPASVVDYLKSSIKAGQSSDVRLRLKGDLSDFPFENAAKGTFQLTARLREAKMRFADAWPEITDFTGDLVFDGKSMRISADKASIHGVPLLGARAVIPDLFAHKEELHVEGQAEDQTADFLGFIEASPVSAMLDGFTRGIRASGNGKLQLRLDIPIRHLEQTKVAGSYQFIHNQVRMGSDLPPLSQVNGRLDFTESGVSARGIGMQALGGPASLSVATRDAAIVVNAQGTANMAALPRAWGGPLLRQATGTAAWQAAINGGSGRPLIVVVESPLTGVALDLPAPLGKPAGQALPFRLERQLYAEAQGPRTETTRVSLGRSINAVLVRRPEGEQFVLDRGALGLGEPAVLPQRAGFAVNGSLASFSVDRWRALLGGEALGDAQVGGPTGAGLPVNVNVKIGALDVAGRRLNDVSLSARSMQSAWTATVAARELSGDITWRPEGRGRLVARLKQLIMPDSAPATGGGDAVTRDMPALDIVAEHLVLRDMQLGRLELIAVNDEGRDWRIEKLMLANADSTLNASGVWQNSAVRPSISVNMSLDVNDAGRFLDRLGYPGTMRAGAARLEGKLGWAGAPYAVDFPTLIGTLSVTASKGQFLKADPGVAKLLGVLSLQSWITLDFRDLFAEGFAFDNVSATAAIAKGVLSTDDFAMNGSAARVSMQGEVDLATETQNLRVRVVPSLGDGVASLTGVLLANPVVGIGAMLAQRIFKDPLGQIFAFEYSVKGNWAEPKVERMRVEPRIPETSSQ